MSDGGPAFPTLEPIFSGDDASRPPVGHMLSGGMSLRQWYAGLAMQAMLANPDLMEAATSRGYVFEEIPDRVVRHAALYAERMIETLSAESAVPTNEGEQK
jgi:hypothetical protein